MPWSGSGAFSRSNGTFSGSTVWAQDNAAGQNIVDTRHDSHDQDLASGINNCLTKDGQNVPTADLPMNGQKHTGVGDGTARNHYASLGQIVDGGELFAVGGGTGDAITATLSPALTALVDGMQLNIRAPGANTSTTPTFSPNGITAHTITKQGGGALVAGDYASGQELVLRYVSASTRWELLSPKKVAVADVVGGAALASANSFTATQTLTGVALNEAQGSDIASASTADIGAATGNYVKITGTTTITALGTVQAGTRRIVEFAGALTLTHNATSLILPTGANITTAAGDVATFVSEGSGNWRCVSYMRANGSVLAKATQADMEAQTADKVVTADNAKWHPGMPKAWVKFSVSGGVVTVNASYNVSGVVRNSAGNFTVSFSTAFSSAHYCALVSAFSSSVPASLTTLVGTQATGSCVVYSLTNSGGSMADAEAYHAAFLGDQ